MLLRVFKDVEYPYAHVQLPSKIQQVKQGTVKGYRNV